MRVNGDAATSTNSPATGAPTITGTPAVGELLTADISNIGDADGIADADFEYQWIAFDGTTDSDIEGATGETYRPLLAHLDQTIKVRVSFDDDNDNAESLTSAATAAVTRLHLRTGHLGRHPHRRGRNRRRRDILRLFLAEGEALSPMHSRMTELPPS